MRTSTILFLIASATSAFAQKPARPVQVNTRLLYDSCKSYVKWKEAKPSDLPQLPQEASAVGYCKGFFQAFALATGGTVTKTDEIGRVQVLKYKDNCTLDELIGTFVDAVNKNSNSVSGDMMRFLLLTIVERHLATYETKPEV